MSAEFFRCFFCGDPIFPGENVGGVICDSPLCQKDLAFFLRALADLYGYEGLGILDRISSQAQRNKRIAEDLERRREGFMELLLSLRNVLDLDKFMERLKGL